MADQIAFYKAHRDVFQRGRFVRLRSPFEGDGNETAWMAVAPDAGEAVVGFYRTLNHPVPTADRLRLRGLDPARRYRVSAWPPDDEPLARAAAGVHGGDELMAVGLTLSAARHAGAAWGDFRAWLFVLEAV